MTRSHKLHKPDSHIADESGAPESQLPRFFAKHGPVGANPTKTKKDGGGKANWGREGDEIEDYAYNLTKPRRRSNSHGHVGNEAKTKFEMIDDEPVFKESIHGAPPAEEDEDAENDNGGELEKEESATSTSGGSIEEEDRVKKV